MIGDLMVRTGASFSCPKCFSFSFIPPLSPLLFPLPLPLMGKNTHEHVRAELKGHYQRTAEDFETASEICEWHNVGLALGMPN